MTQSIVFMFSGQGSHYYQMGKHLFDRNPIFHEVMLSMNKQVLDLIGLSIIDELYDQQYKKNHSFNRTLISHPAIFMIEYPLAQVLLHRNIYPHAVLGTSLGEFTAAVIAGILSLETALKAVVLQAKLLEKNQRSDEAMLAIFHSPDLY